MLLGIMSIVGNCWAQRVLKLKSRSFFAGQWMPNIFFSLSDKYFSPPLYLFMSPPVLCDTTASLLIQSPWRCSALDWNQKWVFSLSILGKIMKMSYKSVLVCVFHCWTFCFEFSKSLPKVFIIPITFKFFPQLSDNILKIIPFSIKILVIVVIIITLPVIFLIFLINISKVIMIVTIIIIIVITTIIIVVIMTIIIVLITIIIIILKI